MPNPVVSDPVLPDPATSTAIQVCATERAERLISTAAVVVRLGSVVLLPVAALTTAQQPGRHGVLAVLAAVAAVQAAVAAWAYRHARRPASGWVAADVLAVAALLAVTSWPAVLGGPAGQSPLFHYAAVAVVVAGFPGWPVLCTVAVTAVPALVTVASGVLPAHSTYPTWVAVPDALGMLGTTAVVWVVAALVRRGAQGYDRQAALAVARAHQLAAERERGRQAEALRGRLMSTLDEIGASGAVVDAGLRDQLRRETDWLRGIIARGLPVARTPLLAGLRNLAAEKGATGLEVQLVLPETEPVLAPPVCEALIGAAREALTNVYKHAGTRTAAVVVRALPEATLVEISDQGAGYDPPAVPTGTGQRGSIRGRLASVGGYAEVRAEPGTGTRVMLRVPG